MIGMIRKAIGERRLISFGYKQAIRLVEPHVLGRQRNGTDAFCGWQVAGGSDEAFRLFRLDEIAAINILDDEFSHARPGYSRGDRRFAVIYAEL